MIYSSMRYELCSYVLLGRLLLRKTSHVWVCAFVCKRTTYLINLFSFNLECDSDCSYYAEYGNSESYSEYGL